MKLLIAVSTAFVVLAAAAAHAQDGGMSDVRAACADDAARLCPNATSKEDGHQCMMQNRDKVSDACKTAVAARRQKMQAMKAAPAPGER